ncbi:hypothetical protein BGZ95_008010, partial [Linnemannia exigua]
NPGEVPPAGNPQPPTPFVPEVVLPPSKNPPPAQPPAPKPDRQPPLPDPPTASPSPTPSAKPPSFGSVPVPTEFPAAAFALEPPTPRPSAIFNPVQRRRAFESPQPCMSQVESLFNAYPTDTTEPLVISSSSGNLSSQNNVAMRSMIGCVFVLMALTVAGVAVIRRMKRRTIELRDIESLDYESCRPVEKFTDDTIPRSCRPVEKFTDDTIPRS